MVYVCVRDMVDVVILLVWSYKCTCMLSVGASSCRCCMFVSCMPPVAVLNVAFCMTCSLLIPVEDA